MDIWELCLETVGAGGIFSGPFHQQLPHLTFQALEKAFRCRCLFWMMAGLALGVVGCPGTEVRIKGFRISGLVTAPIYPPFIGRL